MNALFGVFLFLFFIHVLCTFIAYMFFCFFLCLLFFLKGVGGRSMEVFTVPWPSTKCTDLDGGRMSPRLSQSS